MGLKGVGGVRGKVMNEDDAAARQATAHRPQNFYSAPLPLYLPLLHLLTRFPHTPRYVRSAALLSMATFVHLHCAS